MCRNITTLRGLDPQATAEEIEAAARQYVRKVSGVQSVSANTEAAFELAVAPGHRGDDRPAGVTAAAQATTGDRSSPAPPPQRRLSQTAAASRRVRTAVTARCADRRPT